MTPTLTLAHSASCLSVHAFHPRLLSSAECVGASVGVVENGRMAVNKEKSSLHFILPRILLS